MAKDYVKHHQTKRAAEKLLQERYGDEDSARYGGSISAEKAIHSVLAAIGGYVPQGREPGEVPAEDVLAALAQVDEARQHLDNHELRLIKAARSRGASWQKLADALGLGTRQSAETRALRLERGAQTYRGRDVASQRLDKARERAGEAWCREYADRVREVGEQLYDTSGAWDLQDLKYAGASADLHAIGELLATDASPIIMAERLEGLRYYLAPYSSEAPKPTGKQAAAAEKARTALVELLADRDAARNKVTTVRGTATS
ncbi:hypothetical protein ACIQXD_36755 [Streptomyces uncialis]|uniref:hypothetical protein n=1 Tax=Streptomyces uncialis TaxID=1048205 RepID=UPI0037F4C996